MNSGMNIPSRERRTIEQYSRDIREMDGYVYTGNRATPSMHIFNRRASKAMSNLLNFEGKRIVDIGCGDGTYSAELVLQMGAASVTGIEPSDASYLAAEKFKDHSSRIRFQKADACQLPFKSQSFDVAVMRGVLHHLDEPQRAIREMGRVAQAVFLLEPNGYNPIVKILEKISPYHRAHKEKSYFPRTITRWLTRSGLCFAGESYTSLVPLFCPEMMARFLDWLSPHWERLPILPVFTCGLYCVLFVRP